MKSQGSVAFAGLAGTADQWARRLGKSTAAVNAYRSGARKPPKATRKAIAQLSDGAVPVAAWEQPFLEATPRKVLQQIPAAKASPDATQELADRLQAHAETLMRELEYETDFAARVRNTDKLASIVVSLGKITGQAITNERQILASPVWARIETAVVKALEPWPDAMRAVVDALEDLQAKKEEKAA